MGDLLDMSKAMAWAGVFVAALAAAPCAEAQWTVTKADFQTLQAASLDMDDSGVALGAAGEPAGQIRLSWAEFLQAERAGAHTAGATPPASEAAFVLHMHGGDRAVGRPAGMSGANLTWANQLTGEIPVPLRRARQIVRLGAPVGRAAPQGGTDEVLLANGDTVAGVVSSFGTADVTIQPSGGEPVSVPLDSITAICFAATGSRAAVRPQRGFRLTLSDSSILTVSSLRLEPDRAELVLPGDRKTEVDAAAILLIEQVNGPVTWLSSLEPAESVHIPFLDSAFVAQMDRAVDGQEIRFGQQRFARGIGVHSLSRITWRLDGADGPYRTLRTRYAIDHDLPYANVTVRIKLDDRVVHEQADVTSGRMSDQLTIPLEQAKSLTLEVDYGQGYDVQDRLNWIEPALLR
jgi:hypothetical protein